MSASARQIKCVVVGDDTAGKQDILISYTTGFTTDYVRTIFDNVSTPLIVDGCTVNLQLWDTSGQEHHDCIRPLSYHQTDVFILCFSIISPASFNSVAAKWITEIKHYCPNTPIVLVGTNLDMRDDPEVIHSLKAQRRAPITRIQGRKLAGKIGAYTYIECSAHNQSGLAAMFEEAVRAAISPKKKGRCSIS